MSGFSMDVSETSPYPKEQFPSSLGEEWMNKPVSTGVSYQIVYP